MLCRTLLLPVALLMLASASAGADDPAGLDLRAWQRMPVFDGGRLMPLDSFARSVVRQVCGQSRPTFDPSGITQTSAARQLFPGGRPRTFDAAELLLSWAVEPEKWERVPLLLAGGQLREELLQQPSGRRQGRQPGRVSPGEVLQADRFWQRLDEVRRRQQIVRTQGKEPNPSGVDGEVVRLFEAYTLFRLVTFDPVAPADGRGRFLDRLIAVIHIWRDLEGELPGWFPTASRPDAAAVIERTAEAIDGLVQLVQHSELAFEDAEPRLLDLGRMTADLARQSRQLYGEILQDESAGDQERAAIGRLATMTGELARLAGEMPLALYDNGRSLRLVPGLSAAALQVDRDLDDDSQPWLNLQTLLLGSPVVLREYPQAELNEFRKAFSRVKAAYLDRDAPARPQRFSEATQQLAAATRALGQQIEPLRRRLPIPGDEQDVRDMLAATAYPPEGYTDLELYYNRVNPFFWLCLACLASTVCLALSFVLAPRTTFWLGALALALAMGLIVFGLALRTAITAWVSVTNMFEVIMFVALGAGVLGLWFALLRLLRPGITRAWQMTAGNWLAIVFRVVLAAVIFVLLTLMPYGSGGSRAIVSLLPRIDLGSQVPSANAVLTWAAGWCVLLLALWWLPRMILAAAATVVTVPAGCRGGQLGPALEEVYRHKWCVVTAAAIGLLASLLAYFLPVFDKDIRPLMPVLRDNFWLTVHVLSITASYGAAALAWGLGNVALGYYLFGRYRDPADPPSPTRTASGRRPPEVCGLLAASIYQAIRVAVLLLAVGTVLGALWGDVAWGRFWAWDPKEVWALISLLVYLAILHSRCGGFAGDFGMVSAAMLGATSIVIAWYGVNYLLRSGLHTYAGGAGGLWYVSSILLGQWLLLGLAAVRLWGESREAVEAV